MGGFFQTLKNSLLTPAAGSPGWVAKQNADMKQQEEDRAAQAQQDLELQHAIAQGAKYVGPGGLIQEQMLGPDGQTVTTHRPPSEDEFVQSYPGRKGAPPVKMAWGSQYQQIMNQMAGEAPARAAAVQQTQDSSQAQALGTAQGQAKGAPLIAQGQAEARNTQLQSRGVIVPDDVATTVGYPRGTQVLPEELANLQEQAQKIRQGNRQVLKPGESIVDLTPGASAQSQTQPSPGTPPSPGAAPQPPQPAPSGVPAGAPMSAAPAPSPAPLQTGAPVIAGAGAGVKPGDWQGGIDAAVPDKTSPLYAPLRSRVSMWLRLNNSDKAQQAIDDAAKDYNAPSAAAAIERVTSPFKIAQQVAAAKALRAGDNPAVAGVAPAGIAAAQTAATKLDQEYIKAKSATDAMGHLLDLTEKGNKAAGVNVPLVGVETLNAINGIKRINSAEIDQYGSAGNLLDQIKGKIGKLTVGKPMPQDIIDDVRELHQTLGQQGYQNYTNGLASLNNRTGAKFQPNIPAPNIRKGPAAAAGSPPIVQKSKSTGQYRYSTDEGKTWQPGQPPTGKQ